MDTERPRAERQVVIGVDSFGDLTTGDDGDLLGEPQNIRGLVAEGVLAEESGLDFFGLGEHHTEEIPLSAPDLVLASVAARTSRIHLGSAVTVLSSDDPVRVFQRYATLDALSSGRAEVILGRGSSTESFPLFGFDLADYDRLFEEKLDLFARLRTERPVTWSGTTRAALPGLQVHPRTAGGALPTWVGVGGNPASVVRAARHGLSLMLAIIGGNPARFARLSALFREATAQAGFSALPIGVHSPGHVAATDEQAKEEYWPTYETFLLDVRRQRGFPKITREYFEHEVSYGSLYVGSPETVARRSRSVFRASASVAPASQPGGVPGTWGHTSTTTSCTLPSPTSTATRLPTRPYSSSPHSGATRRTSRARPPRAPPAAASC